MTVRLPYVNLSRNKVQCSNIFFGQSTKFQYQYEKILHICTYCRFWNCKLEKNFWKHVWTQHRKQHTCTLYVYIHQKQVQFKGSSHSIWKTTRKKKEFNVNTIIHNLHFISQRMQMFFFSTFSYHILNLCSLIKTRSTLDWSFSLSGKRRMRKIPSHLPGMIRLTS